MDLGMVPLKELEPRLRSKFDDKSGIFPLKLLQERFKYVNCEGHVFQNSTGIVPEILLLEISIWFPNERFRKFVRFPNSVGMVPLKEL
ncbi:hypothetical protein Ccrd_007182 [Cynara cardunculus var. scolymus]|uniref:Uncharacterized protein n=1 Tax=Cynara cardunculus var. scolymus TaxID=59895 RepID=A0A118JTS3_CYNCS|nr:hypothetical protein Ccrd_007182 [Cynara cardunculus var. scolymus]